MNIEDFRAIKDSLEPQAGAIVDKCILLSIAVSLKRIADRLDDTGKIGGIDYSLDRLASAFERGHS
jgi:hypothetical protein